MLVLSDFLAGIFEERTNDTRDQGGSSIRLLNGVSPLNGTCASRLLSADTRTRPRLEECLS